MSETFAERRYLRTGMAVIMMGIAAVGWGALGVWNGWPWLFPVLVVPVLWLWFNGGVMTSVREGVLTIALVPGPTYRIPCAAIERTELSVSDSADMFFGGSNAREQFVLGGDNRSWGNGAVRLTLANGRTQVVGSHRVSALVAALEANGAPAAKLPGDP